MKSYANIILLENLLYNVPTTSKYIRTLSETLFNPIVKITAPSCGTRLGLEVNSKKLVSDPVVDPYGNTINYIDSVVLIEGPINGLSAPIYTPVTVSGRVLSSPGPRIPVPTDVIGLQTMRIHHPSTCTEPDGICTLCHFADLKASTCDFYTGVTLTKHYYESGLSYTAASAGVGDTVRLHTSLGKTKSFNQPSEKALLSWLANTYFGSLLGIKSFDSYPLPLKPSLLRKGIKDNLLSLALGELAANKRIPENFIQYLNDCDDKLEKAMGIVVTYCVYTRSELQIPDLASAPRGENWKLT